MGDHIPHKQLGCDYLSMPRSTLSCVSKTRPHVLNSQQTPHISSSCTGELWGMERLMWESRRKMKAIFHNDVIKWWKHFPRYWPFVWGIYRSPVNSPHKSQWRGTLMFSLICTWVNGWVNNREVGDLWRHHAHYDVTVMWYLFGATKVPSHSVYTIVLRFVGTGFLTHHVLKTEF